MCLRRLNYDRKELERKREESQNETRGEFPAWAVVWLLLPACASASVGWSICQASWEALGGGTGPDLRKMKRSDRALAYTVISTGTVPVTLVCYPLVGYVCPTC